MYGGTHRLVGFVVVERLADQFVGPDLLGVLVVG
jgi:hypothetical protein